jgi:hypothetical protein
MPLKGLVSLGLDCSHLSIGVSTLPSLGLHLGTLQSLTLIYVTGDVSALQWATALTRLDFNLSSIRGTIPFSLLMNPIRERWPRGLEAALLKMSRLGFLRVSLLDLDPDEVEGCSTFCLSRVLRVPTTLTELKYTGHLTLGSDMRAIASLSGLHSLQLSHIRKVTPAWLPALQAMFGLTELILSGTKIFPKHITPEVTAGFDVERIRLGWPPLKLEVNYYVYFDDEDD